MQTTTFQTARGATVELTVENGRSVDVTATINGDTRLRSLALVDLDGHGLCVQERFASRGNQRVTMPIPAEHRDAVRELFATANNAAKRRTDADVAHDQLQARVERHL